MFVLADILLGNAAAFLAALMVADQFPLLRVGRGSGVVGYAAFFITVLCMFMYTLRYPLKAFFCVLMLAGLALHSFHIPAVLGMLQVMFANAACVGRCFFRQFFRCGNERHRRREDHAQTENPDGGTLRGYQGE